MGDSIQKFVAGRYASEGKGLRELYPGMRGYFVPGEYATKGNDASATPRQLFVQLDDTGKEAGTYYFDPYGKFTNMLDLRNIDSFISDPDSFDPKNPSGFEQSLFQTLQQFRGNPGLLKDHVMKNPSLSIWKQETTR